MSGAAQNPNIHLKDGATLIYIPAGDFLMGDHDQEHNPRRIVYLDAYWIYETPVTVAQYRQFCSATSRPMPSPPSWGWQENHPIVNVTWNDAKAYCDWAEMQLPTAAQWEKAARGTEARQYPWGDDWDGSKCHCSKQSNGDAETTAEVGISPQGASPFDVLDMAGNVWEWCEDWYDADMDARVMKGGSWYVCELERDSFRCGEWDGDSPTGGGDCSQGFRCVGRV